jgi:hypothetical protein
MTGELDCHLIDLASLIKNKIKEVVNMQRLFFVVILAGFAGLVMADEITEIDRKVIETYLQPGNKVPFIDLYTKMTGKKFSEVKEHIKFLQNASAVKSVWNQKIKEDSTLNRQVIKEFLKPRNKLSLVDLYVKMTGNSFDVAEERCRRIANSNEEVRAKWDKLIDEKNTKTNLKENKRMECDEYLKQANSILPKLNYKQHNKCVAYSDNEKFDEYSERNDFKQTLEKCQDTEVEFAERNKEYESLLEKQKACNNQVQVME